MVDFPREVVENHRWRARHIRFVLWFVIVHNSSSKNDLWAVVSTKRNKYSKTVISVVNMDR